MRQQNFFKKFKPWHIIFDFNVSVEFFILIFRSFVQSTLVKQIVLFRVAFSILVPRIFDGRVRDIGPISDFC